MSRQGTVWTPPGPLGQKATRRKGNFRKQPGHPVSIPFLVCRALGRKVVPPGTRHPPEEAGLQAQSTDTRSHLHLGPEQEGPGAQGSRGATSSAPTLGARGSRGLGQGQLWGDEERRPHSRAAADPAQGTQPARGSCRPPSTGTREPWQGHAHANRGGAPEAKGGRWGRKASGEHDRLGSEA